MARANATDAVTEVHAINILRTLDRTLMNREDDGVALAQRYDHRPRLHTWPLLRQYKFAASEISLRFRQQDCELKRKNVLAVEVLMEAIVIAGFVLKY